MSRFSTDERKQQIKQAALAIIAEEGLSSLTTRNLAERVGVSEGALFKHFATKKDIYLGILHDVEENLVEPLRSIQEGNKGPEEKLKAYLCHHVNYLLDHKGITILLFSEATHFNDSDLKSILSSVLRKQKDYFSTIIREGMEEGVWDSSLRVENVAMLYMGIPITLNIELVLHASDVDSDEFCSRMYCLLERVLRKG